MIFSAVIVSSVLGGFVGADIATKGESTDKITNSLKSTKDEIVEFFTREDIEVLNSELECKLVGGATVKTYLCQEK